MVEFGSRIPELERRIERARVTTDEAVREWSSQKLQDRLSTRLQITEKAQTLASISAQADQWLEAAQSGMQLLDRTLAFAQSAGLPLSGEVVDGFLEDIQLLRVSLSEADRLVTGAQNDLAQAGEQDEGHGALQLIGRLAATFGIIQTRLDSFEKSLSKARLELETLERKIQSWILWPAIAVTLLILWMSAGQAALARIAWRAARKAVESIAAL